jgi:hypothetical protein
MKEMADAIAWEITEITLGTAAIFDVTGINATVSVAIAFLRF